MPVLAVLGIALSLWHNPTHLKQNTARQKSDLPYLIKLNGPITLSSAGTIDAISNGYFKREGLDVRLTPGTSDAEVTSLVAADDHVIGLASAQEFLKARANGSPIVAFAAAYIVSPVEFFALSNSPIRLPTDLEGKRIGYSTSPEIPTIWNAFVARNSISQSSLKFLGTGMTTADLINGRIDVLLGRWDIDGEQLEHSKIPFQTISPGSFGVHQLGTLYFANEKAFASRDNIEKILTAIISGWRSAYSSYDKLSSIVAPSIGHDVSSVELAHFMDKQRDFIRPLGTRFGELDIDRLKDLEGLLLQQRALPRQFDLKDAVNLDILREAYRVKSNSSGKYEQP